MSLSFVMRPLKFSISVALLPFAFPFVPYYSILYITSLPNNSQDTQAFFAHSDNSQLISLATYWLRPLVKEKFREFWKTVRFKTYSKDQQDFKISKKVCSSKILKVHVPSTTPPIVPGPSLTQRIPCYNTLPLSHRDSTLLSPCIAYCEDQQNRKWHTHKWNKK